MRNAILFLATVAVISLTAFTKTQSLVVTSSAFTNNGMIPVKYTCLGQEASPPLKVTNIPANAKSLVIVVDDPDAPVMPPIAKAPAIKGHKKHPVKKPATVAVQASTTLPQACFTHWMIWNLETDGVIPENFKNDFEGMNGAQQPGYKGMCPNTGTHHYHFKVYALDSKINISKSSSKAVLEKVMEGHILAWGELVGLFNKSYN